MKTRVVALGVMLSFAAGAGGGGCAANGGSPPGGDVGPGVDGDAAAPGTAPTGAPPIPPIPPLDAAVPTDAAAPTPDDAAPIDGGDAACVPGNPVVPADVAGCGAAKLLDVPADPGARGPWPVGAKTVTIQGLTTEIWYPAQPGSDQCKAPAVYDVREHLPAAERGKIPDSAAPLQVCDCVRDLPLDTAHGPYPVISFIHGTAAFRTQSLTFVTHWASRGFVVVASDHPHIQLSDVLTLNIFGADQTGDAIKVLSALDAPAGDLSFLAGHLDMQNIGASGHSAGGGAVSGIASRRSGIKVVIPMAAGGTTKAGDLASSLVMSAANDGIAQPSGQVSGYSSTSPRKRFVQIDRAGHLVFSDLCDIGASQGGLLAIAVKYGVNGASNLASLANDGCPWQKNASYTAITPQEGWAIVDSATSAVWEETLRCNAAMGPVIANIKTTFPLVKDYEEQLQ